MSNAFVARMTITLDDVTPVVSRVIEVPLGIRLDRLHSVFQAALAWTDSHLWELTFGHMPRDNQAENAATIKVRIDARWHGGGRSP